MNLRQPGLTGQTSFCNNLLWVVFVILGRYGCYYVAVILHACICFVLRTLLFLLFTADNYA